MKFIEAKAMNSFGLINLTRCGDGEIGFFISSLTKSGREMGKYIFVDFLSLRRSFIASLVSNFP